MPPRPPVQPALVFYRHCLRELHKLPDNCRDYYLRMARTHMSQHRLEVDKVRIAQIQEKATSDIQWLLQKYNGPD